MADFIIPETDTPGAKEAGVARFIDTLLAEYYLPAEALQFKSTFDAMVASFDLEKHTDEEIKSWLGQLDQRAFASDYETPSDGSTDRRAEVSGRDSVPPTRSPIRDKADRRSMGIR